MKEFLIRLQTIELRLTTHQLYNEKARTAKDNEAEAYDLKHESGHYDAFPFKSELRVLKDLAVIDLITLPKDITALTMQQVDKLQQRFKSFWINYQNNYQNSQIYPVSYLDDIKLNDLFITHNIKPGPNKTLVDGLFVDDLAESVKLREMFLQEMLLEVKAILNKPEGLLNFKENEPFKNENKGSELLEQELSSNVNIVKFPIFTGNTLDTFIQIVKNYFSLEDQAFLFPLLHDNLKLERSLVFKGNGNQLADAFKQLYEANFIVGCAKTDLEEWISINFEYVYRNQRKTLPVNYLNSIISSNTKPCQSPILDIKKQHDGTFVIVPALRGKKKQ
ncbi:hypothetical protein [uncultured Mucilaginibacter sp.]|uniref:hypothetical protein n=1 Tax=uncultured Mucilaginibacter sp. TaxID=797541 RepID=UPI0026189EBA|nr:hypothetical protein [uncultured Mucilaginibacter sp.]